MYPEEERPESEYAHWKLEDGMTRGDRIEIVEGQPEISVINVNARYMHRSRDEKDTAHRCHRC